MFKNSNSPYFCNYLMPPQMHLLPSYPTKTIRQIDNIGYHCQSFAMRCSRRRQIDECNKQCMNWNFETKVWQSVDSGCQCFCVTSWKSSTDIIWWYDWLIANLTWNLYQLRLRYFYSTFYFVFLRVLVWYQVLGYSLFIFLIYTFSPWDLVLKPVVYS